MTSPEADAIREQLSMVIAILRPYAMSSGAFHDLVDLRVAIESAEVALERARRLVNRLTP
jgi:hypothetical protein